MKKSICIFIAVLISFTANSQAISSRYRMKTVMNFGWPSRVVPIAAYKDSTFNSLMTKVDDLPTLWSVSGNALSSNSNIFGTTSNRSVLYYTNNNLWRKLDSIGISRQYTTASTSTINGSSWFNASGFNWVGNSIWNGTGTFTGALSVGSTATVSGASLLLNNSTPQLNFSSASNQIGRNIYGGGEMYIRYLDDFSFVDAGNSNSLFLKIDNSKLAVNLGTTVPTANFHLSGNSLVSGTAGIGGLPTFSTSIFRVQPPVITNGALFEIGALAGSTAYCAVYPSTLTPTTANYALIMNNGTTYVNNTTEVALNVNGANKVYCTASGCTISPATLHQAAVTIDRSTQTAVTALSINGGSANINAFQIVADGTNSLMTIGSRNSYSLAWALNDIPKAWLSSAGYSLATTQTVNGLATFQSSITAAGSIDATGFARGSYLQANGSGGMVIGSVGGTTRLQWNASGFFQFLNTADGYTTTQMGSLIANAQSTVVGDIYLNGGNRNIIGSNAVTLQSAAGSNVILNAGSGAECRLNVAGTNVVFTNSISSNFQKRLCTNKGANVASTGDLALGTDGNIFHITGNTTINAITTANWQAGSEIILIFDSTPTVKNNTAGGAGTAVMLLAGGADFSATANDVLKLAYDGTSWFESARSVN